MSDSNLVPLGDVCRIIAGQHIEASLYSNDPDGSPYLTGPADFGERVPTVSKWTKSPKVFAADTDVLLTVKGAGVGKSNLGCNAAIGRQLMALRPDEKHLSQAFLFHFLRRHEKTIASLADGATVPGIGKDDVSALRTPLPPLAEQRRIAEVLDRAEALRVKRRAALALLDTLTQALFLDLFGDPATNPKGWPLTTIGDVAEQVTDGEHLTPKRTNEGIKLLSARNIRDGYVDFGDVDYVGPEEYERIKRRCKPSPGDVLISCSGTIGRVASVETSEPFALVRSVALVRPKGSAVGSKFLEHYLRTPALKARMLRRANASSQANLFQGQIRELPVYMPPLPLQRDFARCVAAVEKLKTAHRASLAELDTLFASLQHRAFRGEL